MRIFLFVISTAIIIAIVKAQRKPNITKPVVNHEVRHRPVWHQPPEERKKLSIFPRNNTKFVVTPKTVTNEEAKQGLPRNRPLMRKFVTQDKNDKGTWSFAPRKPLMKTQKFTVTLAPTKSSQNKVTEEMKPEESKKVQTVTNNVKSVLKSGTRHSINKGNLIEIVTMKNDLLETKHIQKNETIKVNDSQNAEQFKMPDNKTLPTFGESLIDVRSFDDDGVILYEDMTINKDRDLRDEQNTVNETTIPFNTMVSEPLYESRTLDSNDMMVLINFKVNNSLPTDSEESNNHNISQLVHTNVLEILFDKILNNTQHISNSTLDLKNNNNSLLFMPPNNASSITVEDIPEISKEEKETTKVEKDFSALSFMPNNTKEETHLVDDTNILDSKNYITGLVADSPDIDNLKNLTSYIHNNTEMLENTVKLQGRTESILEHNKEITNDDGTVEYTNSQSTTDETTCLYINNATEVEYQTQSPEKHNTTDSNGSDSHDLSLEIYESNMPLLNEETKYDDYDCYKFLQSKLNVTNEETFNEKLIDYSNNFEETSNTSISDSSTYYAEERSDESLIDKLYNLSKNLTNYQISNESYSNAAGEKRSNDSYAEKSNNLTEANYSASLIDSSVNFTGEQFSNEPSLNLAGEELSNKSYYADKSNNWTDEIPNDCIDCITDNSNRKHISNESSLSTAEDETSNESYLTYDISKECNESCSNFTDELISNESLSTVTGEYISNESDIIYDMTKESTASSYQFTEEHTSNESSSNISGEVISDEALLDNMTSENFLIGQIDVIMSENPSESSHDQNIEVIAEEALINRFKRSNNVIEEYNLPTTVSGFKYTGQEVRLDQESSYKNINA